MWSRKYNKCIICKTTERKYVGNGMCKKCYHEEYCKINSEKIKIYSKKYYNENHEKIINDGKKYRKLNTEKEKERHKKYQLENPEKCKESQKKYYEANRKKRNENNKKRQRKNPERCRAYNKEWLKENREKYNEYHRKYSNNKRKINLQFRIKDNVSSRIRQCLKKKLSSKNGKSAFDFLPYSMNELKQHLENLFEPWMTWKNWGMGKGNWQIDHKIPESSFSYKSVYDKEFQKCWALENLQPLDAIENIKKGNKIIN